MANNNLTIHHIGIVVSNISQSLNEFEKFISFDSITTPELITSQKVRVCFLDIGNFRMELIEPANSGSPISNFAQKGGGFHHICFEVENLDSEINLFIKKGAKLIVKPTIGFEGRKIAFLFLNNKMIKTNLIELAEKL